MGLSYAAKLLPLLQGSAANTLKAASGVQSWLISNRRHPLVAQAVLNSGWESRSDAAAADYAALTGVLDGMLEEVEVSGDAAAAGQLMGLFRQGSIGGKAAYVLGRSTAAQDALAARVAAQPAHRLQRLSASQIVTLASSIAAVGSQSAQAALLDISRRIGALVQRHGDSTGQHLGWAHPNTKAALEVAHAKQKAAAQAGYSQLLTDLCAAIDALPPAEKVALPLVASGLTVLPASVAAVAHKRPAYMGSTPPAVYFSHARTYSDSFEAALTGKLQSAKQEGQAAAVDLEAVTAAEAAAAAAAARSYAGKKATAAENRRQFRELFEDTLAKLSPASKAALPAHPTMLSDLPDAVTAPLGLEGACDRLGLPRTRPACLGTGTTSLFWSNNMKAKPAVFQEPLYALLHTARQQGAAALTKAAAAPAAQPSGDEDTALAPPAKRARRRPLGDNNNS